MWQAKRYVIIGIKWISCIYLVLYSTGHNLWLIWSSQQTPGGCSEVTVIFILQIRKPQLTEVKRLARVPGSKSWSWVLNDGRITPRSVFLQHTPPPLPPIMSKVIFPDSWEFSSYPFFSLFPLLQRLHCTSRNSVQSSRKKISSRGGMPVTMNDVERLRERQRKLN